MINCLVIFFLCNFFLVCLVEAYKSRSYVTPVLLFSVDFVSGDIPRGVLCVDNQLCHYR